MLFQFYSEKVRITQKGWKQKMSVKTTKMEQNQCNNTSSDTTVDELKSNSSVNISTNMSPKSIFVNISQTSDNDTECEQQIDINNCNDKELILKNINNNNDNNNVTDFKFENLLKSKLSYDDLMNELEDQLLIQLNEIDPINSQLCREIFADVYHPFQIYLMIHSREHLLIAYMEQFNVLSSIVNNEMIPKKYISNTLSFSVDLQLWYKAELTHDSLLVKYGNFVRLIRNEIHNFTKQYYGANNKILTKNKDELCYIFGSCQTGLQLIDYSDIDLGINFGFHPSTLFARKHSNIKKYLFWFNDYISKKLQNIKTELILNALMPIMKINYNNQCNMDISIQPNVTHLILISRLLTKYVNHFDQRCKKFILFVKYWSIKRNIYSAVNCHLSSFVWTLLCISYLQSLNIPLLPVIHAEHKSKTIENAVLPNTHPDEYEFITKHKIDPNKKIQNNMTLGELVYNFFSTFGNKKWTYIGCDIARFNDNYKTLDVTNNKKYSNIFIHVEEPIKSNPVNSTNNCVEK